jgi:glutamate synthase (NADPH/NADH) small chain
MRTSSSHDEGCARDWAIGTKEFIGENGVLKAVKAVRLEWKDGRMSEIAGSEFEIPADYVFLAMGFVSPVGGVLDAFGIDKDNRGNARADTEGGQSYATSVTRACSPPATCAAASRWWSGPSAKAASARAASTSS